ncbi:MAG: hypothetical protein WD768_23200 [Phycisphaeraceae bacterium]
MLSIKAALHIVVLADPLPRSIPQKDQYWTQARHVSRAEFLLAAKPGGNVIVAIKKILERDDNFLQAGRRRVQVVVTVIFFAFIHIPDDLINERLKYFEKKLGFLHGRCRGLTGIEPDDGVIEMTLFAAALLYHLPCRLILLVDAGHTLGRFDHGSRSPKLYVVTRQRVDESAFRKAGRLQLVNEFLAVSAKQQVVLSGIARRRNNFGEESMLHRVQARSRFALRRDRTSRLRSVTLAGFALRERARRSGLRFIEGSSSGVAVANHGGLRAHLFIAQAIIPRTRKKYHIQN